MKITDLPRALWRKRLLQASFKGALFHVEVQSRSGGRRIVEHEYPKRDKPYGEDMGRHAIRWQITGYVISEKRNKFDYQSERDALIVACDTEGGGRLIDPYLSAINHLGYPGSPQVPLLYNCERYTYTETRQQGGYAVFEMVFTEAGEPGNSFLPTASAPNVNDKADTAAGAVAANLDRTLQIQE